MRQPWETKLPYPAHGSRVEEGNEHIRFLKGVLFFRAVTTTTTTTKKTSHRVLFLAHNRKRKHHPVRSEASPLLLVERGELLAPLLAATQDDYIHLAMGTNHQNISSSWFTVWQRPQTTHFRTSLEQTTNCQFVQLCVCFQIVFIHI